MENTYRHLLFKLVYHSLLFVIEQKKTTNEDKFIDKNFPIFSSAIHSGPVLSCTISSTGHHLASCSEDKTIHLIKFQPGTGAFVIGSETKKLRGHRDSVNDVKFSQNAEYLTSASQDKTIRVWDTATGACVIVLDDPFGPVQKLCYSSTGSHMISLSSPGNFVSVWNTETNMVDNVLEANNGREIQVEASIS